MKEEAASGDEEMRPNQRRIVAVTEEKGDGAVKFASVVLKLLGVQEEGVFRTVVSFL